MKRRRIIIGLTFTFLALVSSHLYGQTRLGLRTGMDLASRSFSESVPYPSSESYRSGLVVGLTAEQDLGDIVSLTAEPVYVQKGSTTSIFLNGQNQAATSKANYLEIPVVIKLRLLSGLISPYITAGPYVSFLLSADGQTEIGDRIEIYDQKEFTRPIEIGVQGGIGGEYDLSTSLSFLVEVRYSRGLSKVLKEPFSQTLRSYGFLFTASILYTL